VPAPFTLSVVVPCLNEEENVALLYAEVVAELDRYDALEILFVDDGSTDGTLARVRELAETDDRVSYLSFTRNFGLEAAFSAGYRYARHDWILHIDADLQFPPAEAHHLIVAAQAGYQAVFGIRVARKDRWVRRFSSRVHDLIARRLLGIELPAGATTFRLVRAALARRVVDLRLGTPYFLATIPKLTSSWTTVPTAHRAREHGEPKVRFAGLARHAVELFTSYSSRPMTAAVLTSLGAAGLAVAGAVLAAFGAGRPAITLIAVALAGGLAAQSISGRYLVDVGRGQARVPLFLIGEANIEVDEADRLMLRPLVAEAAR
jgi:glycosyltransferase involved in cell wall biosynthesis